MFRSVRFFVGSVGVGAALMYFYDPQNGRQRRVQLRDRCQVAIRELEQGPRAVLRDAGDRARASALGASGGFGALLTLLGLLSGGIRGLALGAIGSSLIVRATGGRGGEALPLLGADGTATGSNSAVSSGTQHH